MDWGPYQPVDAQVVPRRMHGVGPHLSPTRLTTSLLETYLAAPEGDPLPQARRKLSWMAEPRASRPLMPGYGIVGPDGGSGLLPWSWAEEQLQSSHNFWLATRWPDGRPHVMPVWAVWHDDALWFSSSKQSRKARNLAADPRCVLTTEDSQNPVVVEGSAELLTERRDLETLLAVENAKYGTDYGLDMFEPAENCAYQVRPTWVFGLRADEFTGSPTRWIFANAR